ncbi:MULTISPECIES: hypothetical protein [Chitinophaga]|jgi:hypothetical protein|uniref:Uncharacterized protein n=1 Tax=Chitinophaga filiformis TaxID=104663 RepID=A0ABY4I1E5_CHIFI|nr:MULTISPECIES: hypothetical protein [Chitinophaga]MCF6406190.1 hypothetical protein [Chitinophaga filiformis]UPK68993.1 hypothetical protein MYF79_28955 [Chitinophaga filiformis]SHL95344.1 hypothetical protein SAMN05216311_101217 [Chitinophaga sp. CF418]
MANKRDRKGRNVGRIGNRYRLVIMNDNTYEEVTSFKLSRMSVYIALSTLFVLLVTITVATVVFTPLRYYIPGYGDLKQRREFIRLKMRTDSLESAINARDKYLENIKQVINGDFSTSKLDTTTIKVPKVDNSTY